MTPSEQARAIERAARFARMKCACGAPVKSTRHRNCDACRKEKQRELMRQSNERRSERRKTDCPPPQCATCGAVVTAAQTYCKPCRRERVNAYQRDWARKTGRVANTHTQPTNASSIYVTPAMQKASPVAWNAHLLDMAFPELKGAEHHV